MYFLMVMRSLYSTEGETHIILPMGVLCGTSQSTWDLAKSRGS